MSDIVDQIDALIDDQLAAGEPHTGFDFGDPTYPRCGHCGRHWHGLPITERIAGMYTLGEYDEDYRSADDTTRVLCQGSDFIGPMPFTPYCRGPFADVNGSTWFAGSGSGTWSVRDGGRRPSWLDQMIETATDFLLDTLGILELIPGTAADRDAIRAALLREPDAPLLAPGIGVEVEWPEPITFHRWMPSDNSPPVENRLLPMRLADVAPTPLFALRTTDCSRVG